MRIISGFTHPRTPDWNAMVDNLVRSARRFGYHVDICGFPSADEWLNVYPDIFQTVCWKYKLHAIIDQLKARKDDFVWVDADCLIWREIDFEAVISDCDIAFTLRDIDERKKASDYPVQDGYLNTGVMFFRNNERTLAFLERAREKLLLSIYEQEAINKVILSVNPMAKHGEIIDVHGTKVKVLNCRDYNFIYLEESPGSWERAKILHYKGEGRKVYKYHVEKLFERRSG